MLNWNNIKDNLGFLQAVVKLQHIKEHNEMVKQREHILFGFYQELIELLNKATAKQKAIPLSRVVVNTPEENYYEEDFIDFVTSVVYKWDTNKEVQNLCNLFIENIKKSMEEDYEQTEEI